MESNTTKIKNGNKTYFSFTFSKEDGETVEKQTRKTSVWKKNRINIRGNHPNHLNLHPPCQFMFNMDNIHVNVRKIFDCMQRFLPNIWFLQKIKPTLLNGQAENIDNFWYWNPIESFFLREVHYSRLCGPHIIIRGLHCVECCQHCTMLVWNWSK